MRRNTKTQNKKTAKKRQLVDIKKKLKKSNSSKLLLQVSSEFW